MCACVCNDRVVVFFSFHNIYVSNNTQAQDMYMSLINCVQFSGWCTISMSDIHILPLICNLKKPMQLEFLPLVLLWLPWFGVQMHPIMGIVIPKWIQSLDSHGSDPELSNQKQLKIWQYVTALYTLRPRQNGRHFADDTLKPIFLNENIRISIEVLWSLFLKFQLTIFQH